MKAEPKIGMEHRRTFVVQASQLITFADDRMPAVLATPALIQQLEFTARDAVANLLEPNERTVGTEVDVKHLAPTPLGFEVTCMARVLRCDAGEITFQVEASDAQDLLCRGVHRRRVVDADRIRRRVERKLAAAKTG
jgi:fluoroacetyl-CoA thioesterase